MIVIDFCELTKELWRIYFSGTEQEAQDAMQWMTPDCVVIGTGGHEFYSSAAEFTHAVAGEIAERKNISFQFQDFWCKEKALGDDTRLVYGTIHIWWENEEKNISINMDSRFSFLYHRTDGVWKIVFIHQSVPNREQKEGEYYPKSLIAQIKTAQMAAVKFAKLAETDGLTGLMNYSSFQRLWQERADQDSWLFIMDLDDFKQINDTYGHITGNRALQRFSHILRSVSRSGDLICRMGGDEFIVFCRGMSDADAAARMAKQIFEQAEAERIDQGFPIRVSIGGTAVRKGERLDDAVERADQALYDVKRSSKNGYLVQQPH